MFVNGTFFENFNKFLQFVTINGYILLLSCYFQPHPDYTLVRIEQNKNFQEQTVYYLPPFVDIPKRIGQVRAEPLNHYLQSIFRDIRQWGNFNILVRVYIFNEEGLLCIVF